MSYMNAVIMSGNQSLISRIGACAAEQGVTDPMLWAQSNVLSVVSQDPQWSSIWATAEANKTANNNPDTGARTDVISDAMILSAVQSAAGL